MPAFPPLIVDELIVPPFMATSGATISMLLPGESAVVEASMVERSKETEFAEISNIPPAEEDKPMPPFTAEMTLFLTESAPSAVISTIPGDDEPLPAFVTMLLPAAIPKFPAEETAIVPDGVM
ncbi:MAG TPA: hypothetical protein VGO37_19025 [Steroidobacteraceae bacterium]|nr:hypothetical protein [Steroidobacteraceae bacterium]